MLSFIVKKVKTSLEFISKLNCFADSGSVLPDTEFKPVDKSLKVKQDDTLSIAQSEKEELCLYCGEIY